MLFQDYVESIWVPNLRRRQIKPSTLASYASMLKRHVYPSLAGSEMREIQPQQLEALLSALQRYSPKYQRNVALLLRAIFNHAVESEELMKSPIRGYHMPKVVRKEKSCWTEDQVKAVLDATPAEYKPLFKTLAFTGMRIGEVLGLSWKQIDFRQGWIEVTQSLWNGHVYTPKTEASMRVITMGPDLYRTLQEYATAELARLGAEEDAWGRKKALGALNPESLVFPNHLGKPFQPDVLRRNVLYPVLYRLGWNWKKGEGGFHCFRHSAGSIVVSKTGNLRVTQKLLGHSSITTTANIYTHVQVEELRGAVEILEKAILG